MNRITLFILLLSSPLFAQNSIQKGYYIDLNNVRIEGYINVTNFLEINFKNKSVLIFKKNLEDECTTINASYIKEFGVGSDIKYQKIKVQIDDSNLYKDYNYEKELVTLDQELFLNVLVEGDATLYEYQADIGNKYFYTINSKGKSIEQLIYKKYLQSENKYKVRENLTFRKQLFENLNCDSQTFNDYLDIKYTKKELSVLFENYNKCNNNNFITYKNKLKKETTVNIIPFMGIRKASYQTLEVGYDYPSKSNVNFGFGAEVELMLPSQKWSFSSKLEFERISIDISGQSNFSSTITQRNSFDGNAFNLFLGSRRYIKINEFNQFFIDAFLGLNFPMGNIDKYQSSNTNVEEVFIRSYKVNTNAFFSIGLGYVFNKKYGIDLHYDTDRNLLPNVVGNGLSTKYSRLSLNLRYTIK